MSIEEVYICDKLEGLVNIKPDTRPCRKAVSDGSGVAIGLTIDNAGGDAEESNVQFCGARCANFWLKRQRVPV